MSDYNVVFPHSKWLNVYFLLFCFSAFPKVPYRLRDDSVTSFVCPR